MKKSLNILLILGTILIFYSCRDISDFGNNLNKITIAPAVSKEDSLSFIDSTVIHFGSIRWQRVVTQYVVLNNLSADYAVNIYDIKLSNNIPFSLAPEKGFPVVIPPLGNNSDNRLVAIFKSPSVTPGFYQDTVYLNGSNKYQLLIQGTAY